jgi:Nitroreductase family.
MARAGALAPSGDNLQPWSFVADGEELLIRHDPRRDLSLFNVRCLASYISLGAVLENIAIAASNEGYRAVMAYSPNAQDRDLIAKMRFEAGADKDALADFLDKRCTNRKPYASRPISPDVLKRISELQEHFPTIGIAWTIDKFKLKQLGQLVSDADRLIFENERIHAHLFSTIRWTQAELENTRDGLPIQSLELGRAGSLAFRGLKRWSVVNFLNRFGFSRIAAKKSVMLMRRCSAAALITAPDTSHLSFMLAGRAFQRVWLQATKEGLAVQPMTAIIFLQLRSRLGDYEGLVGDHVAIIDKLRDDVHELHALPKDRVPAMILRIGFSSPPSVRTMRRPIPEV